MCFSPSHVFFVSKSLILWYLWNMNHSVGLRSGERASGALSGSPAWWNPARKPEEAPLGCRAETAAGAFAGKPAAGPVESSGFSESMCLWP